MIRLQLDMTRLVVVGCVGDVMPCRTVGANFLHKPNFRHMVWFDFPANDATYAPTILRHISSENRNQFSGFSRY